MATITLGMVEMIGKSIELDILTPQTDIHQADSELRILPAPAHKVLVETVHPNSILPPESEITGLNSR